MHPMARTPVAVFGRLCWPNELFWGARGGSGVIVTEGMRVHPSSTGHGHGLRLYQAGTVDSVRPGRSRLSAVIV